MTRGTLLLIALVCSTGCGAEPPRASSTPSAPSASASNAPAESSIDSRLAEVARIHGGAGPWAVAGYRMGEHALQVLGMKRGSFDLEIVHRTPREVQYSCIADGAAAATGASLGKLNLTLEEANAADTQTTYRDKSTGRSITLRPTRAFQDRFANVARPKLGDAGREVMTLPDADIFEAVP